MCTHTEMYTYPLRFEGSLQDHGSVVGLHGFACLYDVTRTLLVSGAVSSEEPGHLVDMRFQKGHGTRWVLE